MNLKSFTADSNEVFLKRNYTEAELRYANGSHDPHATLAGRWCAKEAVFKSLGAKSKGAGAALGEIEIVNMGGAPGVKVGVVPKFLTGCVD